MSRLLITLVALLVFAAGAAAQGAATKDAPKAPAAKHEKREPPVQAEG